MKTYSNPQRRYLIIALIVMLGFALVYMSWMIFNGIMGAVIFYTIFRSSHIYLTEKKGLNTSISSLLIIVLSFLLLILPVIAFVWMVYTKITYYETNPEQIGILKEKFWPMIKKYISNKKNVDDLVNSLQSKTLSVFSNFLNSVTDLILQITVMYFLLYFMLKEHRKIEGIIMKFLPLKKYHTLRLGTELTNITYSNLLGQGFISFIQGLLMALGFLIFGLSDPLFWGVICFFLSFIPLVGASVVFVPAGILQIYSGDTFGGIGVMLWGFIIVTSIDNVIRFYLSKKIGDVHPVITIIGVIIGIPAFGILGLVFGPLLISYFILLVKIWEEDNLA
ncbi:MAG TPA: AI-2E family transporter [Cytophagaceae bacterium]|jgi:predicted PurR-regulated permease PerM|nr:AI-2E family transporter [Cytophagaceae bacterium]